MSINQYGHDLTDLRGIPLGLRVREMLPQYRSIEKIAKTFKISGGVLLRHVRAVEVVLHLRLSQAKQDALAGKVCHLDEIQQAPRMHWGGLVEWVVAESPSVRAVRARRAELGLTQPEPAAPTGRAGTGVPEALEAEDSAMVGFPRAMLMPTAWAHPDVLIQQLFLSLTHESLAVRVSAVALAKAARGWSEDADVSLEAIRKRVLTGRRLDPMDDVAEILAQAASPDEQVRRGAVITLMTTYMTLHYVGLLLQHPRVDIRRSTLEGMRAAVGAASVVEVLARGGTMAVFGRGILRLLAAMAQNEAEAEMRGLADHLRESIVRGVAPMREHLALWGVGIRR
ncbi:MAG: hypothetical protein AB7K09_11610 [Planctomycetota bacterium]